MSEFETIFYQPSPDGLLTAIVEQDDRVAYFYLHSGPSGSEPGIRSAIEAPDDSLQACWLRNLVKGPIAFEVADMQQGVPPILPRIHCSHADGLEPLDEARLDVIWFEEGNGAALTCDGEIEAIIPAWSGADGFHGYARHCKSPNQVCWPMPRDPAIMQTIDRSREYWSRWKESNPWPELQQYLLTKYNSVLGDHSAYYAIDGDRWPPKAIAQYEQDDRIVLLTVGVSLRAQPFRDPDLIVPADLRRVEFGMVLSQQCDAELVQAQLRIMSSIANYPWYAGQWIGPGHTYPFESGAESPESGEGQNASRFPRVLFTSDTALGYNFGSLRFCNDLIRWLWVLPMTEAEMHVADQRGLGDVVDRFKRHDVKAWDPNRGEVI